MMPDPRTEKNIYKLNIKLFLLNLFPRMPIDTVEGYFVFLRSGSSMSLSYISLSL